MKKYQFSKSSSNLPEAKKFLNEETEDDEFITNFWKKSKKKSLSTPVRQDSWIFDEDSAGQKSISLLDKKKQSDEKLFTQNKTKSFEERKPSLKDKEEINRKRSKPIDEDIEEEKYSQYSDRPKFLNKKQLRPKPDLGDDIIEDLFIEGETVRLPAKVPARDLPPRFRERQREIERQQLLFEQQQKLLREEKRRRLKDSEENKLKEKYWLQDLLGGAQRSHDDRGHNMKVIFRKKTLTAQAEPYEHGKNAFHNQFIQHPSGVYAGRFYIEPKGAKKTEENGESSQLYFFIEHTGAEGLTVRVDKKFYEVFEGDVVQVPPHSIYSLVNPSENVSCSCSYLLIDVQTSLSTTEEGTHQQNLDSDDVLDFDFRKKQE